MEFIPRDVSIVVGTTVLEVSPETGVKRRVALSLANDSAGVQAIYIAWGKDAVAGSGIVLRPGASWVESVDSAFHPSNLRITTVASAAGAILAVHERVE